jgi:hypothetical protein
MTIKRFSIVFGLAALAAGTAAASPLRFGAAAVAADDGIVLVQGFKERQLEDMPAVDAGRTQPPPARTGPPPPPPVPQAPRITSRTAPPPAAGDDDGPPARETPPPRARPRATRRHRLPRLLLFLPRP